MQEAAQKTILVVDDEDGVRESVREALSDEGYRVVDTADGTEVLRIINEHRPELVLLDIWMPQVDGIGLLKEIKSQNVVPFAQKATKTIPMVMWVSNDPVKAGFVASLARPGGNITGVTLILDELAGKRLALLKEVISQISRVAVLWNPDHADPEFKEIEREAKALAVHVQSVEVRRGEDFDSQFQNLTKGRPEAIIVVSSRLMQDNRRRILEFAAKQRLPVIGDWGRWAPDGALLSYGPDATKLGARMATYVDKILKGAKAGDLPIERPSKFELVINLKTAKQIGLTIPPNVLARADRVIR